MHGSTVPGREDKTHTIPGYRPSGSSAAFRDADRVLGGSVHRDSQRQATRPLGAPPRMAGLA